MKITEFLPAILDIPRRFQNQGVLVVGDIMLDRYVWGSVTRVSPEAPVPIVAKSRTSCSPGGAGNVAATIAALGGTPRLIGVAGFGSDAEDLRAALSERGVRPDGILLSRNRKTTVKTRIVAHSQQLLRIDDEDLEPIDDALADELCERFKAELPSSRVVVLSDYAKGLLTPKLTSWVIQESRRQSVPVLVDPKGSSYARYNGASLLTPNQHEAFLAAGLGSDHGATVEDAGARLMHSLEIDSLLITQGESGMTLFERPGLTAHLPACARIVYDVTGAGDAVIATLALSLAAGASLREATLLANVAGGLAVEQVGTAILTSAAIESALEHYQQSASHAESGEL
jgi:rfaE bifunctional protein kinase chain/domain